MTGDHIMIKAVHLLRLECIGCPDKAEINLTESGSGSQVASALEQYGARHEPCRKKLDEQREAYRRSTETERDEQC